LNHRTKGTTPAPGDTSARPPEMMVNTPKTKATMAEIVSARVRSGMKPSDVRKTGLHRHHRSSTYVHGASMIDGTPRPAAPVAAGAGRGSADERAASQPAHSSHQEPSLRSACSAHCSGVRQGSPARLTATR